MKSFYISPFYVSLFTTVTILLYFFGTFYLFLFWMLLFLFMVFSFRKVPVNFKEFLEVSTNSIYTPICGRVKKIRSQKEIELKISFMGPFGIFMPNSSEVVLLTEKIKTFGPFKRGYFHIILRNKDKEEIAINIESWYLFNKPKFWVRSGDRGRLASNIGLVPFGGKVLLTFSKNLKLRVTEGEKVKVGVTVIAHLETLHE